MRRREALVLYAFGAAAVLVLAFVAARARAEPVTALFVACATAFACGALALPLVRPLLQQASADGLAAALLASSTLAVMGPVLALVASPTVRDAFHGAHFPIALGSIVGLAVALPMLVRAWRGVREVEWKPLAIAALVLGALVAIDGETWLPIAVFVVHALAFAVAARHAWKRDALILPDA